MSVLSLLAELISLGAENTHGFSCLCFPKLSVVRCVVTRKQLFKEKDA